MGVLGSRVGWAFVVGHWVLFGVAVWERGGLWYPFHAYYEPWLLLMVLLADVLWVVAGDILVPGSLEYPAAQLLITGLLAGIQWYLIGHGLERWSEGRRLS